MSTVKTKNELRYNYNVSNNKEVLQKCTHGQVSFTDAYVFWLEEEWLKANGIERSSDKCHIQNVTHSAYQLCPKCNGQGIVSKPPWVAGDVYEWSSTQTQFTCDVCNGAKIIPQHCG